MVEEREAGGSTQSDCHTASMLARTWCLASLYGEPTEYDIPEPPSLTVTHPDGGLALAGDETADPFIRAEQPARVRR